MLQRTTMPPSLYQLRDLPLLALATLFTCGNLQAADPLVSRTDSAYRTETRTYGVDNYGNVTSEQSSISGGGESFATSRTTTYKIDTTKWLISRPDRSAQTATNAAGSVTRTVSMTYSDSTGFLDSTTVEPDKADQKLVSAYTYDAYGNVKSVTQTGVGLATGGRITSAVYAYSIGGVTVTNTNAVNQTTVQTYDAKGLLSSAKDVNNLTTSWSYDSFGRVLKETRPDNTVTQYRYGKDGASGQLYVRSKSTGSPVSTAFLDKFGRETKRIVSRRNSGDFVVTYRRYDAPSGQLSQVTRPAASEAGELTINDSYAPISLSYTYDVQGRPTSVFMEGDKAYAIRYAGLQKIITSGSAGSRVRTETYDALGRLKSVLDENGKTQTYSYDPFGRLTKVTDANGTETSMTYDERGRRKSLSDKSMGSLTYGYNALDQLTSLVDAKSQTASFEYDNLGRQTKATWPDLTSQWIYDNSLANGAYKGRLYQALSDNGAKHTYNYDSYGRPITVTDYIGKTFTTQIAYDTASRPLTTTYGTTGVKTQNVYLNGYLNEVHRVDGTDQLLWQLKKMDGRGNVLEEKYGNGVVTKRTFDAGKGLLAYITASVNGGNEVMSESYGYDSYTRNLNSHQDINRGIYETYAYDNLDQLTGVNVQSPTSKTYTYQYDGVGNLTYKTGVGTYTYPQANARYANTPASITGTLNGVANPTFAYDLNGNMSSGAGRTYTWFSWNMPNQICNGTYCSTFLYDADHNRVKQSANDGTTTIYLNPRIDLGGNFEEVTKGGATFSRHTVYGAGGPIAQIITGSQTETRYLHGDRLGSIAAVTGASGSVIERFSYDAWGKRRNVNASDSATWIKGTSVNRGYTQHEELDNVGLINMNARVYDPDLGKFTSPDSWVSAPDSTTGFNRYAYVGNNPMMATDPSGHEAYTDPIVITSTYLRDTYVAGSSGVAATTTLQQNIDRGLAGSNYAYIGLTGVQINNSAVNGNSTVMIGRCNPCGWSSGKNAGSTAVVAGDTKGTVAKKTPQQLLAEAPSASDQIAIALIREFQGTAYASWLRGMSGIGYLGVMDDDVAQFAAGVKSVLETPGVADGLMLLGTIRGGGAKVPTVTFSSSRAPGLKQNFDNAVANGAPTTLNRTDMANRDLNRRQALRGQSPAPAGQSLDEYPFACSVQGGCGSFVRAVPIGEQNYQGGVLSRFFQDNGIKVGDPFKVRFGP